MVSPPRRRWERTLALVLVFLFVFGAATLAWLWPVVTNFNTAVPGSGAGDNLTFVWNVWWARRSLLAAASPLWCPVLFVPFGVSLVLHTHALLPAAVAALFTNTGTLVAATNAIVCVHLFLNLAIVYALAFRVSRTAAGSALGAVVFGWSPYVAAHLLGHFNLIAAWVLPLDALLALKVLEFDRDKGGRLWSVLLGLALAATAYTDYYYTVYAVVLIGILAASRFVSVTRRSDHVEAVERAHAVDRVHGVQRATLAVLFVLFAVALAAAAVIAATGGTTLQLGSRTISMRSAGNPIGAAVIICVLGICVRYAPMLTVRVSRVALFRIAGRLAPAAVVGTVCIAPLGIAALRLWLHGDYSSQAYFWRSAPAGIDVATLALGNPRGLFWSHLPLRLYDRFRIDGIEQVAWISPAVVALCLTAWRAGRADDASRRRSTSWVLLAAVFFVWALGPYAVAVGHQLPVPLPAILVRFIPIVANARIPARAMVVVYLALAMLTALSFAALRRAGRARLACALAGLVLVDLTPAPPPVFHVDHPAIYDTLRARPERGGVCELPLGLRDGFGVTGTFDSRVLWYQTIHERALAGGFVARLPRRMIPAYDAAPVLGTFLRLSSGEPSRDETPPPRDAAAGALLSQGIRFVIVNHTTAPADLVEYVTGLGLRRLAADGTRELWIVERHER
ncbi:MAG TPA: hypothetical protein VFZ98_06535 [Vicinamibacterales bacterium]